MATVNLYLHRKDRLGQAHIYVIVQTYGKKAKLPTGVKLHPDHWDSKNQKVKKSYRGFVEANSRITLKKDEVYSWVLEAEREGVGSVLEFVRRKEKGQQTKKARKSLLEDLQEFIEVNRPLKRTQTIKTYSTLLRDLRGFQETEGYRVDFDTIDHAFEERYRGYLIQKGNIDNTQGKKIQVLKSYLENATKRRVNNNHIYKGFKSTRIQPHKIALTLTEVKQLLNLDLSSNKRLSDVRDVFCFGCLTGLRFSDLEQLKQSHVGTKGDSRYIELPTVKTGSRVTVSLPSAAVNILERHRESEGGLLPMISNQKTNQYLKELCKLAGFDSKITTAKDRGAERIVSETYRFEMVSMHTARKTYASILAELGVDLLFIKNTLGHSNIQQTVGYITQDAVEKGKAIVSQLDHALS